MKKSEIYYYLSFGSILLTFTTGLGIFASIILLVMINAEKRNLKLSNTLDEFEMDFLKKAKRNSIINLVLNTILIVLGIIALIWIFIAMMNHPPTVTGN